jgi:hypothetical protein
VVRYSYWCDEFHPPRHKTVIYSRDFNGQVKCFVCIVCDKRFSHKDLGLVVIHDKNDARVSNPERVNALAKLLRENCKLVNKGRLENVS